MLAGRLPTSVSRIYEGNVGGVDVGGDDEED